MRNKTRAYRIITFSFWLTITIIPIIGIIMSVVDPIRFYSAQEEYRQFVVRYGRFTPIAFICLQILQVVITPLSHYSVGYMGGFLFGPVLGSFYNYVGRLIGHISAFYLSRTFGRRVVRRLVPLETLEKYDHIVNHPSLLFLIYFLPLFPDDEISYLVGLSTMRFRMFLLANLFGHVGGSMSLAYLGSGIDTRAPLFWILFLSTLGGFPLLWYLAHRARANSQREDLAKEN